MTERPDSMDPETETNGHDNAECADADTAGTAGAGTAGTESVDFPEEGESGRTRQAARAATWTAILAAVAVLAGAAAGWFAIRAQELRDANAALSDTAATKEVAGDVARSLKAVLSYSFRDLDRTERAARRELVGAAAKRYRSTFDAIRDKAREQGLTRSTTVREVGVRELGDHRARLLVFVDQRTIRRTQGAPESRTARMEIIAREIDGNWRIAEIRTL